MAYLAFKGLISEPEELVAAAAPQALTANWVDIGAQLYVAGAVVATVYVNLDINDSVNARIRALASMTEGGDEYVLPIRTIQAANIRLQAEQNEFHDDIDQLMAVPFYLGGAVPWIQFQVQTGVVGAAAGQIDEAHVITSARDGV